MASEQTPPQSNQQHADGVDQRGDQGMGFSHTLTGHHFRLLADGGAIEVEADHPDDNASKAAIRKHMEMIAGMFGRGDFTLPMFIHNTIPPGVEVMKRLKGQITYRAKKHRRWCHGANSNQESRSASSHP